MSLKGKVAVVTGGGSGIGRAISLQLAKDGAAISVWDLDAAKAQETVDLIAQGGGQAIACVGDASAAAGIQSALERTRAELGPVTILVNNAGTTGFCPIQDITEDAWDRMMRINLKGPFLCTQASLPDMLAAGWGRIVNITSSSTQIGSKKMAHYVSSKGGLAGFTKALASEFARNGITVNNVPPNFIDTPMLREHVAAADIENMAKASMMGHAGQPEDIAAAVAYLCSVEARHINGHTLSVNGGNYMN